MHVLNQERRSLKQRRLSISVSLASCVFLLVVSNIFTNHNGTSNLQIASENIAAVPLAIFKRTTKL